GEGELPDLGEIEAAAGDGLVEVAATEVPDDWADRWRDFHKPLLVADRLWLRPSWEPSRDGAIDVVVDPGQAFGTGAHPTTRLCLQFLCELEPGGELVDLGTGSGVLAIAAAKLGWTPIRAYDHEPAAIEAASANAAANNVDLSLERANLREDLPELAPTTVANMTAPILLAVAELIRDVPQTLVCSGLLPSELDQVAAAFARVGLREKDRRQDGDWAALLLRRG
ncbi:MAG TPA: 50S ribosomal protein L11 methyltransferase, partial [Solirubrobacterales bacterium]|nr:50S ribosomal protein L11 methyltransferase [Solirubrobacterales bacterium]